MSLVPVVLADANVLYSGVLRDLLIYLALADAIELHWSAAILDEMAVALIDTNRITASGARRLVAAMTNALPDAAAEPAPLPSDVTLPDPRDHHVLAAALTANASVLLTFNGTDFPEDRLSTCGSTRPVHPDAFFLALLAVDEARVIAAVAKSRRKLSKPPFAPAGGYCVGTRRVMADTSAGTNGDRGPRCQHRGLTRCPVGDHQGIGFLSRKN